MFRHRSERQLATVLFVDIVDSTRIAADVGDRRWRELVGAFRRAIRRRLREFDGREVDTAGDSFFATFASPAMAVRAASAVVWDAQQNGLEVRCGVHTGELERIDGRLGGIAAHIGARVAAVGGPAEILVTSTVRDLVVGADLTLEHAHDTDLKGVPGRWMLHRVTSVDGKAQPGPMDAVAAVSLRQSTKPGGRRDLRLAAVAAMAAVVLLAAAGLAFWAGGSAPGPSASASPRPTSPPPIALVRLTPSTGAVLATVRDAAAKPGLNHLIVGDGNLWHVQFRTLARRDLETGAAVDSLELPFDTWQVHYAFGSVWVGHGQPVGVMDRIDATSGRPIATIEPRVGVYDSVAGSSAVYLLTVDSRVLEIDPLTNAIVDGFPTGTATPPVYISFHDGRLYLCECAEDRLAVVDPATPALVDVLESPQGRSGPVDPATGLMWIADRGASTVTPYDLEAGSFGRPIGLAGHPRSVAVGFGWVWVAAEEYVYRITARTHEVQEIELPEGAYAVSIGIDVLADTIWVASCHGNCEDP